MAPHSTSAQSISRPPAGRPGGAWTRGWSGLGLGVFGLLGFIPGSQAVGTEAPAKAQYIAEYRVLGARELPRIEVENAVYPFLGPGRTDADVEAARAALEKAYHDKGFQAASVQIPSQRIRRGVVFLQVSTGTVGRLRVRGARYFLPSQIKAMARSLAEGRSLNFNDVQREMLALNQLGDRQVTPSVHEGLVPGTVDVDLTVADTFTLHGSLELNNRYSADTEPLRLNGSISYSNLWQLGHAAGFSFQISPQDLDQVKVFSGYYLARVPGWDNVSFTLQGTKQDSNVSTLGSVNVVSPGETIGARVSFTLPPTTGFFHSASVGLDYKHFREDITLAGINGGSTPITYFPFSASYDASWIGTGRQTDFSTGVTLSFRGLGSDTRDFDNKRFGADGAFIYVRGNLAHTQDLPGAWQAFARVQGQLADGPLVNNEQFAGGGLESVRGYLEASQLGDQALFGTAEVRTPSLLGWWKRSDHDWRIYAFADAGLLRNEETLPDQENQFELASLGFGTRLRLFDHFNGSLDAGFPLLDQNSPNDREFLLTFRVWSEF